MTYKTSEGGTVEEPGEEDDLDKLLNQYEQQAAQDLQRVQPKEEKRRKLSGTQQREEALQQPLAADNKGFKLLAAMGYKPGQGLGKSVEGRSEPIPLDLKQNRLGLGAENKKAAAREAQRQREREAADRAKHAQHEADLSLQLGRQRTAEQFAARRLAGQLRKSQQVCESLDIAAGITANYLWQPPPEADSSEAAPESDVSAVGHPLRHRLHNGTSLRLGQQAGEGGPGRSGLGGLAGAADDELLEEAECFRRDFTGPGQDGDETAEERRYNGSVAAAGASSRLAGTQRVADMSGQDRLAASEGRASADVAASAAVAALSSAPEGWHELPVQHRLEDVLRYLREQYQYCLFCGCRYEDAADLYANCPGLMEGDHE
ncbi:hypothetical protein N2152v2_005391 [Parachlorella kessleri]